jgi:hypothetical protein
MQLTRSVAFVPAAEAAAARRQQRQHHVVVAAAGQGFASGGASKKAASSASSKKVRRGGVIQVPLPFSAPAMPRASSARVGTTQPAPWPAARCSPRAAPPPSLPSSLPQQPKLARYLEVQMPAGAADKASDDGWVEIPDVDVATSFLSKPIKPIILATGRALCLYKVCVRMRACMCFVGGSACIRACQGAGCWAEGWVAGVVRRRQGRQ